MQVHMWTMLTEGWCNKSSGCRAVYKGLPGYGCNAMSWQSLLFWERVAVLAQQQRGPKQNETGTHVENSSGQGGGHDSAGCIWSACGCSGQRRCGRVRVSARISGVLATSGHLSRRAHEMTGALQLKKGEGNWAVGKGL